MEDTILHKLSKWLLASSVSLLALPISLFVVIFSLYPDLLTGNNFRWNRLKSYYDICDSTREDYEVSRIQFDAIDKKYNHYLFIDATLSTKISDNDKSNFKKSLNDYLADKNPINGKPFSVNLSPTDSIKKYLYYTLLKNYVIRNNCDTLYMYFYKGETNFLASNLLMSPIDSLNLAPFKSKFNQLIQNSINQKTNFRNILDSIIPEFIEHDSDNILTVFSDFYHDDTGKTPKVLYRDFIYFQNSSKIEKYNFIALWSDDSSVKRKIAQNELMRDLQIHLNGVKNTDYVFVDDYNNDNYYFRDTTNKNLELLTLFDVNDVDFNSDTFIIPPITFSSIITNEFNYNEGEARIVLYEKQNKNPDFYWHIKGTFNSDNHFKKFKKIENAKEDTYFFK
jgi:hypothetical protein